MSSMFRVWVQVLFSLGFEVVLCIVKGGWIRLLRCNDPVPSKVKPNISMLNFWAYLILQTAKEDFLRGAVSSTHQFQPRCSGSPYSSLQARPEERDDLCKSRKL